jgi:hypothetical protein
MPYLHKPQPPNLLSDIRSFYQDYNLVENYYAFEYNFDILLVDLVRFLNIKTVLIVCGLMIPYYVNGLVNEEQTNTRLENIYIFFRRHYCYKNMDAFKLTDVIINNFEMSRFENITRKTRFLWGLMRPIQRTRFINEYVLIDEHM